VQKNMKCWAHRGASYTDRARDFAVQIRSEDPTFVRVAGEALLADGAESKPPYRQLWDVRYEAADA
jgi:hypothetical protein